MKTARQIRIEVFGKCTIDDLDDLEKMSREVDNAIILAQTEAFIEGIKEGIENYNQGVKDALKLAAEKATIEHTWCIDLHEVDKYSILNLEKELLK